MHNGNGSVRMWWPEDDVKHTWAAYALPYLEEGNIFDQIDFDLPVWRQPPVNGADPAWVSHQFPFLSLPIGYRTESASSRIIAFFPWQLFWKFRHKVLVSRFIRASTAERSRDSKRRCSNIPR